MDRLLLAAMVCCSSAAWCIAEDNLPFPGTDISAATATKAGDTWVIGTSAMEATFSMEEQRVRVSGLRNLLTGERLLWSDNRLFAIRLKDRTLSSPEMKPSGPIEMQDAAGNDRAVKLSERLPGKTLRAGFEDPGTGLKIEWRAILRDGSNDLKQELTVSTSKPVAVQDIIMIDASVPDAVLAGYTDGAPVVAGNWFMGLEHPMAKVTVSEGSGWTPADMAARQIARPVVKLAPGNLNIRFDYTSGHHRIDVRRVELVVQGTTVAEDVHDGFAGNAISRNEYVLKVPAGVESGELVATLGGVTGENNSFGEIVVRGGELSDRGRKVTAVLPRQFVLDPGRSWVLSTAIGVAPPGQMRRAFAYYLQRERAHPYRQYWHYNSWYDLNINRNDNPDPLKRMTEEQCLEVIAAFDTNLYRAHGVGLDGFVWDDGWDDWDSLWQFHKGFPNGFAKLAEAARKQGAGMGAWLSPWGGYGGSKNMRVKYGKEQGYETNAGGFSLGGAKYYAAFSGTCIRMIKDYRQNYFKFDGIGGGTFATGAPASIASDLDNLTRLLSDLRRENPDVFINCTVGTWASPYWVMFADSIWRQGDDTDFSGKGNDRERWINYKDKLVYDRFVSKSPFFPVNALMYHGLVVGPRANPGKMPQPSQNLNSFKHEMRMMAAYASGLGELYVTPSLMTPESWAEMANCIKWARQKKEIVVDSHWIGGDPSKNQIYGFAAYNPRAGGVVTLRNPDDKAQTFQLDLAAIYALPDGEKKRFRLLSPHGDQRLQTVDAESGSTVGIALEPFEVLVFESTN